VLNMAVFWSSLTSCFPGVLLLFTSLTSQQFNWFSLIKHFFPLLCQTFLNTQLVSSITIFCFRIHRPGWRLSSLKHSCNLFRIIVVVDSTNGITQTVFSCSILIRSSFKSAYYLCFSWMVTARNCHIY